MLTGIVARPKRAYHHGHLREALLDAAERALDAHGEVRLSLRALARQAGVTHTAAYHHFADLDTLLRAVATRGFERLGTALAQVGANDGEGFERMGMAYVEFAVEHGGLFRLIFSAEVTRGRAHDPALQQAAQAAFEVLLGGVKATSPNVDAATVQRRALASWALVHGLAGLLLDEQMEVVGITRRDHAKVARQVLQSVRFG